MTEREFRLRSRIDQLLDRCASLERELERGEKDKARLRSVNNRLHARLRDMDRSRAMWKERAGARTRVILDAVDRRKGRKVAA